MNYRYLGRGTRASGATQTGTLHVSWVFPTQWEERSAWRYPPVKRKLIYVLWIALGIRLIIVAFVLSTASVE
jgi:hypothetical protein